MPENTTALIAVDVQNDFCEGGSLAVAGGARVAADVTSYLHEHPDRYAIVIASQDWHAVGSDNGGHIALPPAQPDYVDSWPPHCIAGTPGAEFHPDLDPWLIDLIVRKGQGRPAYSAFEAQWIQPSPAHHDSPAARTTDPPSLHTVLRSRGVTHIEVVGLALDYCVKATALKAAELGFHTTVHGTLAAAVHPEATPTVLAEMQAAGVDVELNADNLVWVSSEQNQDMLAAGRWRKGTPS